MDTPLSAHTPDRLIRSRHNRIGPGKRLLLALAALALTTLGCSAADWLEQERATPTPAPVLELQATFTPIAAPVQTLVFVTPPADGRPGVIIVPPGMDPSAVLPVMPTEPPTLTPTPTVTPVTTASPLAEPIVVPDSPLPLPEQPSIGTPIAVLPTPTETPADIPPPPSPIVIPPDTPTPMPTATPTPTATPFVIVPQGSLVALRTGPDVSYPQIAQLGPNIPVAITGQSIDGNWLQICCISGDALWVPRAHVTVINGAASFDATLAGPPPLPTVTPLPTETPLPTPTPTATPYAFERAIGPQFFPSGNQYITIWAKLFIGTPPLEVPAAGYRLMVLFEGAERPNARQGEVSSGDFEFSATPGSGNRVEYNYKYEWFPPDPRTVEGIDTGLQLIGTGTWSVFVTDGSGTPLSEIVSFTTTPSNPNREIYLGWVRMR